MRPVTLHLGSARHRNRYHGGPGYQVTVDLGASQIAAMRTYYRRQRKEHGYPTARMLTLAQFAVDWQRTPPVRAA